jgi:alkylation response protein AidB-like acyl-CoA dehydrogenase
MTASRYLTPERLELQGRAWTFAMEEVLPVADELDAQRADIPDRLMRRIAEMGYFGILVDREHGGLGLGVFEYALIAEELARAWMSVASIIARANGMGTHVGDAARRAELLRRSARGDWVGAAALSEPGAGSDLANVQCRAERVGDEYVIRGEKRWCGNALNADFILLLCRERDPEPDQPKARGLISLVIEKERGRLPDGLRARPIDKIGYFGLTTFHLWFEGLRVPAANRVGSLGEVPAPKARGAFNATLHGLNIARIHTAARAIGLARGALEDALAYAKTRVQFDRPIGSFQAIRFKLADMATEVEAARAFMYQVAQQCDDGLPVEKEAAMVKLFATEMAERVTSAGLQVHGGNGYTTEYAAQRHWRDARLTTIFEGTSEIQRRIISDRLLGERSG